MRGGFGEKAVRGGGGHDDNDRDKKGGGVGMNRAGRKYFEAARHDIISSKPCHINPPLNNIIMASAVPSTSAHTLDHGPPVPLFTHTTQYRHYLFAPTTPPRIALSSTDRDANVDEEAARLLQQYYLLRLPLLSKAFGLSEKVLATSMSYFKRYWLQRGVAEPLEEGAGGGGKKRLRGAKGVKVVMLNCLYLATKTHSTPIALPAFAARISSGGGGAPDEAVVKETEDSVRDHEFEVATVLNWQFRVTHAFEAARGMALDLQCPSSSSTGPPPLEAETLKKLLGPLNTASHSLRLTDAEFRYTPSQLALGTWWYLAKGQDEGGSVLDESERSSLRALLEAWVKAKEEATAAVVKEKTSSSSTKKGPAGAAHGANGTSNGSTPADSASSTATLSSSSLSKSAEEVSALISQGMALEARLKGKDALEQVKAIDARLKEWAAGKEKQEDEVAASTTVKRKAEDGDDLAAKRAKVDAGGLVDSDDEM